MPENVIPFNAQARLIEKVNHYISAVDQLVSDGDQALDLLLGAFAVADHDLKIKIVLLLGALANPKVVAPLLTIMQDIDQGDAIRQAAAIQLSVVGGIVTETGQLVEQLLAALRSDDPFDRANAAFALGWEGNLRAVAPLIECLVDEEIDVQQAAVNALSNLQEDHIFAVLAKRLRKSPKEQQRTILYNLGHFESRHDEITQICRTFIHHSDADLRYDALVVLNSVSDPADHLALYEHCFKDSDACVRELALTQLVVLERIQLLAIEASIRALLNDDIVSVHQAAIRLIHQMHPTAVVFQGNAKKSEGPAR
jgi:HEAT repeat protein